MQSHLQSLHCCTHLSTLTNQCTMLHSLQPTHGTMALTWHSVDCTSLAVIRPSPSVRQSVCPSFICGKHRRRNLGVDPPVLNSGGIIPRNMAATELQLEYNAIALSVNDFVTSSNNRKEIFAWASSWYNCHRVSTFLKNNQTLRWTWHNFSLRCWII